MKHLILGFIALIILIMTGCTALKDDIASLSYQGIKRVILLDYCYLNPEECKAIQDMNISTKSKPKMKCVEYRTYNSIKLECER